MCHHICPIGNATGHERSSARARALGISLVNRNAIELSEIMDNIYECCTCGGCVNVCVTGWDPVMFTKETRLKAALEGALPEYINKLVDNCLETGNAYGKTEISAELERLSRLREKSLANMAAAGYQRLAFGSICDAISLLYKSDPSKEDLEGMDLFLVSEIKRPKDGSMEIKFFDRLKALEKLGAGGEHETGAKQLFDAISNSARAVNDKENGN